VTVRCPRCGTIYRQPGRARRGASSTYRCARCRHVFDGTADEPELLTAAGARTDDDPPFTFGDEEAEEDDPPPAAPPPRGRVTREPSTPARFALRALLAVTVGYATLSVYLYTHPESTRQLLEQIPILGPTLAERRLHPDIIQLADVRGEYQRVKGDRLVFVISGTAVNGSPVPVRGIQIEGRIIGGTDQRQVVFCGATPRDVHDLSLREISLLQTLEPPKDWALAPGDQASFMIVFAGPPPDLHEFAAEVVAVQAPGRVGVRSEDGQRPG
jgi:rubredoxin